MSANSLVVSSLLSLLSTVSSTTTSYVLHIVRHVESIKNFMSAPITTAYDILVEENSTEVIHSICQLPPWFSPPGCRCHQQYRRPPTCMSLMSSEVDNIEITSMSTTTTTAYHNTSRRKFQLKRRILWSQNFMHIDPKLLPKQSYY